MNPRGHKNGTSHYQKNMFESFLKMGNKIDSFVAASRHEFHFLHMTPLHDHHHVSKTRKN
jgi:hypothetical protein